MAATEEYAGVYWRVFDPREFAGVYSSAEAVTHSKEPVREEK
jgi:hypothetical protein